MDIGRAFAYVFDDAEWLKKILIGGLISLIPVVGGFIQYGYMLEIVRRTYEGRSDALPEWDDIAGYLVRGFLAFVGLFIWFLPLILFIGCVVTVWAVSASGSDNDAVTISVGLFAFGVIGLLVLLVMVWAVIFVPIIGGRYAIEQRFGAMFEFGEIIAEVRRAGLVPLLLLFVVYLAASFISQLGIILCFIGVIFTGHYSYLVMAHGAGQVYRRARGLEDTVGQLQGPTF